MQHSISSPIFTNIPWVNKVADNQSKNYSTSYALKYLCLSTCTDLCKCILKNFHGWFNFVFLWLALIHKIFAKLSTIPKVSSHKCFVCTGTYNHSTSQALFREEVLLLRYSWQLYLKSPSQYVTESEKSWLPHAQQQTHLLPSNHGCIH